METKDTEDYDLNEYFHAAAFALHDSAIESHEAGHLRYERRKGVRKIQPVDCNFCKEQGLDDGKWQERPAD